MTQQEVADYLGITKNAVGNLEQRAMRKIRSAWSEWEQRDRAAFAPQKRREHNAAG